MAKVTQEEYINRCIQKWGDRFDLSRIKYNGVKNKVEIGCSKHGWIWVNAKTFLDPIDSRSGKYGCTACGKDAMRNHLKLTFEEFVDKANKKFDNKYTYSHSGYEGTKSTVQITCPIHGNFKQRVSTHLGSVTGCTKCGIESRVPPLITDEEFKERAVKCHGNKFSYSDIKIEWMDGKSNRQVIGIYCNQHKGYFDHDLTTHLRGTGCPVCHWRNKNTDDFVREAIEQHGNKYTYDKARYSVWDGLVTITCPVHGDWDVKAYAHTRKDGKATGCPICGDFLKGYSGLSHFRNNDDYRNSPCELYLVEIEGLWKIGLAANTDKRNHAFPRTILYRRLSTRGNVWVVEQNLLIESLFAKPESLHPKFNNWDGVHELRRANFIDIDQLIDMMDSHLDECEEIGWEKYVKKYYVTDANLF